MLNVTEAAVMGVPMAIAGASATVSKYNNYTSLSHSCEVTNAQDYYYRFKLFT